MRPNRSDVAVLHPCAGILTGFPFGSYMLSATLGSTYPSLTTRRNGNLTLSAERILTVLRFYYYLDSQCGSLHGTLPPRF